jgi:hypothetical protein
MDELLSYGDFSNLHTPGSSSFFQPSHTQHFCYKDKIEGRGLSIRRLLERSLAVLEVVPGFFGATGEKEDSAGPKSESPCKARAMREVVGLG